MIDIKREVGDKAWIHFGDEAKTEGTVVHVFERYGRRHYIIEIQTHIDPLLEVRDGWTLSDDPNKPIGAYRRTEAEVQRLYESAIADVKKRFGRD